LNKVTPYASALSDNIFIHYFPGNELLLCNAGNLSDLGDGASNGMSQVHSASFSLALLLVIHHNDNSPALAPPSLNTQKKGKKKAQETKEVHCCCLRFASVVMEASF